MLTMTIMLMHVMDVMASVSQRYLKRLVTIWRRNIGPGCSLSELLSRPVATTSRTEPTDGRLFCRRCCPDFTCDRYNLRTSSPYYLYFQSGGTATLLRVTVTYISFCWEQAVVNRNSINCQNKTKTRVKLSDTSRASTLLTDRPIQ